MNSFLFLILIFAVSGIINYKKDEKRRGKQFSKQEKKVSQNTIKPPIKTVAEPSFKKIEQVVDHSYDFPHEEVYTYDEALLNHSEMPERVKRPQRVSESFSVAEVSENKLKRIKKIPLKKIDLKEAYLWKEILDKPVSMRKDA